MRMITPQIIDRHGKCFVVGRIIDMCLGYVVLCDDGSEWMLDHDNLDEYVGKHVRVHAEHVTILRSLDVLKVDEITSEEEGDSPVCPHCRRTWAG